MANTPKTRAAALGIRRTWISYGTRGRFALAAHLVLLLSATAVVDAEDRSVNGVGNNRANPAWGSALAELLRITPASYADGVSEPSDGDRPNPRRISNLLAAQEGSVPNGRRLSDWVWQWGQFLDHDLSLSTSMVPPEPFDVEVPAGDPFFDPEGTGTQTIRLNRSIHDPATGTGPENPRQQLNEITSYIDASQVYGSDPERAAWLRTGVSGRLKTGPGNLLPFSDGTQVNSGPGGRLTTETTMFTAGDIRANEQAGLIAVHTLFVREHNRLCDLIAADQPDWSDEEVYQRARKIVGALMQAVTYQEFLPALLGPRAPAPADASYSPSVNATIANVFAHAIYRFGHSLVSPRILRLREDGTVIGAGNLALRDAFFNVESVLLQGGIDPILRGLAAQGAQELDPMMVDDLRNFLFGPPGAGGFDLASLNIQRGRDHGLPDYNTVRESFGLRAVGSFAEITADPDRQRALEEAYGGVDGIDVWVGALAEDHLPGAGVGELIAAVLRDQFVRLRDGDRFWYALDPGFTAADVAELEATRLSDIIRRNTGIENIPDNVFFAAGGRSGPTRPALCGVLNMPILAAVGVGLMLIGGTSRSRRGCETR